MRLENDFDLPEAENLRNQMVETQLIPRGISDERVLKVFRKVPRHKFVSRQLQKNAYDDNPLSIGCGQTISQPYMVALMTECLELKGNEKVLEVGTGCGYQTAILAEIAKEVYSVERIEELAKGAKEKLDSLGYKNIKIKIDDGTLGWKEFAPFDAIIVTAGSPNIPKELFGQLTKSGKMAIPVGNTFSQMLTLVEKENNKMKTKDLCPCVFVPLIGKEGWNKRFF